MSDLENFTLSESSEGVDSGAFERLREKMAQARGQIAKDKKQEGKQKKHEDKLFSVLQELLKHIPPNHPLIKKIVSCLSNSIPSQLILVTIALSYKSLHKTVELDKVPEASTSLIPTSNQDLQDLLKWISLFKQTLHSSKQSDHKYIYNAQEFSPSLKDLLYYILNDYFTKKQNLELTLDQKQTYIENIAADLNSPINPNLEPSKLQNP